MRYEGTIPKTLRQWCDKKTGAWGSDRIFVIREESAGGGYSNSYRQIRSSKWFYNLLRIRAADTPGRIDDYPECD